jgi:hypothetical protein
MLESLLKKILASAQPRRCRSRAAFAGAANRRPFKISRGAAGGSFPSVKRIAKHLRNRGVSAEKMHLKTVGLLFRARFRVNAPDIWFGVRIGSSSHEALPNN